MYYKDDWPQAKERLEAFWCGVELVDRCCVAVFSSRKNPELPRFSELEYGEWFANLDRVGEHDQDSLRKWWMYPEENYRRMVRWFENTSFGGEAVPCTHVNWGAMPMAAFFGSAPIFTETTVWYQPVIEDWKTWE